VYGNHPRCPEPDCWRKASYSAMLTLLARFSERTLPGCIGIPTT